MLVESWPHLNADLSDSQGNALRQVFGAIKAMESGMKAVATNPTPVAFGRHF
jgi:hypothetical protein